MGGRTCRRSGSLREGNYRARYRSASAAKDAKLVLYCGGGYRSALAADALRQMGYTNAISLDGGWRAYQASGLPVEK